jgi:hypothetical protein
VLTVSNLELTVSDIVPSRNTTNSTYILLPPIMVSTDQPNITVTFTILNDQGSMNVNEPPDDVEVQYSSQDASVSLSGNATTIAGMLSNGTHVQYSPKSTTKSADICIYLVYKDCLTDKISQQMITTIQYQLQWFRSL